jgi:hypothetical protein
MELIGQKLSQTVKNTDGSESVVVDVFNTAGLVSLLQREPKLRERQLIERTPGADKGMVETFSVRRPALDSGGLARRRGLETICRKLPSHRNAEMAEAAFDAGRAVCFGPSRPVHDARGRRPGDR